MPSEIHPRRAAGPAGLPAPGPQNVRRRRHRRHGRGPPAKVGIQMPVLARRDPRRHGWSWSTARCASGPPARPGWRHGARDRRLRRRSPTPTCCCGSWSPTSSGPTSSPWSGPRGSSNCWTRPGGRPHEAAEHLGLSAGVGLQVPGPALAPARGGAGPAGRRRRSRPVPPTSWPGSTTPRPSSPWPSSWPAAP